MLRIVLLSTYELGRQPFGLSSPAMWLRKAGHEVSCVDMAVEMIDEQAVREADLIGLYVPMHTATRIAIAYLDQIRQLNQRDAHICAYGLYAPINEDYLRRLGVGTIIGGEFEEGLVSLAARLSGPAELQDGTTPAKPQGDPQPDVDGQRIMLQIEPVVSLARQAFEVPDRAGLPELSSYAKVDMGDGRQRIVGYTEATRGCKHVCRHCPIVPIYGGRFRVVQRDVVLGDIRQQVASGAQHITFGDPDFFNGPTHAVAIVRALHEEYPDLSYDVTIKIEHLKAKPDLLPVLRDTGCLFVTSAVEAVDEPSLAAYEKNHTRQDFIDTVREFQRIGLNINPTFVTFSPWTTVRSYADLLHLLLELSLVRSVSPIQYAIRLLITAKSRLLELDDIQQLIEPFDEQALVYRWKHPDPRVDALFESIRDCVEDATATDADRGTVFQRVWRLTHAALDPADAARWPAEPHIPDGESSPSMTEPWYCCAEPTDAQLAGASGALI